MKASNPLRMASYSDLKDQPTVSAAQNENQSSYGGETGFGGVHGRDTQDMYPALQPTSGPPQIHGSTSTHSLGGNYVLRGSYQDPHSCTNVVPKAAENSNENNNPRVTPDL